MAPLPVRQSVGQFVNWIDRLKAEWGVGVSLPLDSDLSPELFISVLAKSSPAVIQDVTKAA